MNSKGDSVETYQASKAANPSCKENCILELFRLDEAATYRVGYVCIRQLALLLRNASISAAKTGTDGNAARQTKTKTSKKAKATKGTKAGTKGAQAIKGIKKSKVKSAKLSSETLVSWSFVRAMFLWSRLVSDVKALKELAYPLYMVILGAIKSQSSLNCAPFCLHGLRALNDLAEKTQKLVPLSALLLRLLEMDLKAIEKAAAKSKGRAGRTSSALCVKSVDSFCRRSTKQKIKRATEPLDESRVKAVQRRWPEAG